MSEIRKLTSIRVQVMDCADEQVWIQSTISATHKLPRNHKDDFTFGRSDLLIIKNHGEDECTFFMEVVKAAESGVFIGSNRRGGRGLTEGDSLTMLMRAGEVLSVRSYDAVEPVGTHGDGSPIGIRPGQGVVA